MGCVELRRVEAGWYRAFNEELVKLVLDGGKIEEMNERPSALVVLVNPYSTNELVHWCKPRTPSSEVSPECLRVLVRLDLQRCFQEHIVPTPVSPEETDE